MLHVLLAVSANFPDNPRISIIISTLSPDILLLGQRNFEDIPTLGYFALTTLAQRWQPTLAQQSEQCLPNVGPT